MVWAKARKFSGASAAIFAFTALSATTALIGSTAPKALLYKDCAVTALIGLIFLASCVVARKPVVFYMAQRWGTDGTHDGWRPSTMWDVASHQLPMGGGVSHAGRWNRADHPPDPHPRQPINGRAPQATG